ncbi:hypothetical protein SAMN05443244_0965 [Terriglobus roseus]|uniref:Uncharacterized protein n=1 Tax=Terriglobus roseus TaxID=392734 RepID=A0A1H4K411_9BACT|nr:hypothetical protein SAMN05443244_0965 [Terriglobus roseus]
MDTELGSMAGTQEVQLLVHRLLEEARALAGFDCIWLDKRGEIKAAKHPPEGRLAARGVFLHISPGKDRPIVYFTKTYVKRWDLTTENIERISRR